MNLKIVFALLAALPCIPAAYAQSIVLTQCYTKVIVSPNPLMGPDRFSLPGALSTKRLEGGGKELLVLSAVDTDENSARQAADQAALELRKHDRVVEATVLGCSNTPLTGRSDKSDGSDGSDGRAVSDKGSKQLKEALPAESRPAGAPNAQNAR